MTLFLFAMSRKELANTLMFSMLSLLGWKLSSDHDRRERGGSKEENQTDLLEYLFARKKGRGRGFLHMCITNIGQKNLSTNEGLQSNIHESTGLWQHGGGVVGGWGGGVWGLEDGMGGRMNRWEERQKAREGVDMGKVFVSQRGSPDRFPSIHNALTAKNASCFPCFLLSLFVVKCNGLFQRPVSDV